MSTLKLAQHYTKRFRKIARKMRFHVWVNKARVAYLMMRNTSSRTRGLLEMENTFCDGLSHSFNVDPHRGWKIGDFLEHRLYDGQTPLRVCDIGAGMGAMSIQLKQEMNRRRIPTKVVAIDPLVSSRLRLAGESKEIDEVVKGRWEDYDPKESFDLVVDGSSALHYTPARLRRELLMKSLHSLKPGGVFLGRIEVMESRLTLRDFLESKKKRRHLLYRMWLPKGILSNKPLREQLTLDDQLQIIGERLVKQGFYPTFQIDQHPHEGRAFPTTVLMIIKRKK